ncbi:MAG: hypothetical protein HS115_13205 [Spirochaetales bacterium]|nr:hypothetical protein [Spirochaetales bacterium]
MKDSFVNRFAIRSLFFLLLAGVGQDIQAQVDPLLREDWISRERGRALGFAGYISNRLERTQERIALTDEDGRNFSISFSGEISFSPLQGGWRPVVPDTSRTALHLAEADGLLSSGLKDEALLIYRALVAMSLFSASPAAADVRDQARRATQAINALRKEADFLLLDQATDPYLFYDSAAGETVLLSDRQGYRLRLPGKFSFLRGRSEAVSRTHERSIVYLKQADRVLAIGSDLWSRAYKMATIPEYVHVRDGRRPLTVQLKETLSFERTPRPVERCQAGVPRCQLYRSSLRGMGLMARSRGKTLEEVYEATTEGDRYSEQVFDFFEFYLLRPNRGFYAELRFSGAEEEARPLMEKLIEKAVFSSSRSD